MYYTHKQWPIYLTLIYAFEEKLFLMLFLLVETNMTVKSFCVQHQHAFVWMNVFIHTFIIPSTDIDLDDL